MIGDSPRVEVQISAGQPPAFQWISTVELPSPFADAIRKRLLRPSSAQFDPAYTFDIEPETGLRPLTVKQYKLTRQFPAISFGHLVAMRPEFLRVAGDALVALLEE
jgi:hypothetical protein